MGHPPWGSSCYVITDHPGGHSLHVNVPELRCFIVLLLQHFGGAAFYQLIARLEKTTFATLRSIACGVFPSPVSVASHPPSSGFHLLRVSATPERRGQYHSIRHRILDVVDGVLPLLLTHAGRCSRPVPELERAAILPEADIHYSVATEACGDFKSPRGFDERTLEAIKAVLLTPLLRAAVLAGTDLSRDSVPRAG